MLSFPYDLLRIPFSFFPLTHRVLRLGCGDEFMGKWLCFFMGVLFYWVMQVVCVYHKETVFFCGEELVGMPNNHSLHRRR